MEKDPTVKARVKEKDGEDVVAIPLRKERARPADQLRALATGTGGEKAVTVTKVAAKDLERGASPRVISG